MGSARKCTGSCTNSRVGSATYAGSRPGRFGSWRWIMIIAAVLVRNPVGTVSGVWRVGSAITTCSLGSGTGRRTGDEWPTRWRTQLEQDWTSWIKEVYPSPMPIFNNGMVLTDDELKALPIDHMAVWLDMWYEAVRDDADRFQEIVGEYDPIEDHAPAGYDESDFALDR